MNKPLHRSFGVVIVFQASHREYLLVRAGKHGHWGFPKGTAEPGEDPIETAIRELEEETGIRDVDIIPDKQFEHHYKMKANGADKHVTFFVGAVDKKSVKIDKDEVSDHRWLEIDDALEQLTYESARDVLKEVDKFLDENLSY